MPPQKIAGQPSSSATAKKPKKQTVKATAQTIMPEGMKVQVHERQTPPESYRICNGTTFETYQPKPWGR